MLTRKTRCLSVTALLLLFFTPIALAEVVEGKVADVSRNALDLTVYDNQGRAYPNKLHLKLDSRTRMYGFAFMGTPQKQDAVRAEISQERPGVWRADTLNLITRSVSPQQTTKPVTASLMDALKSPTGQKIIRGGLTGAITGATASAASGGKTVKGALIGAGVGALGGILMDLFGQGQTAQTSQPTSLSAQNNSSL